MNRQQVIMTRDFTYPGHLTPSKITAVASLKPYLHNISKLLAKLIKNLQIFKKQNCNYSPFEGRYLLMQYIFMCVYVLMYVCVYMCVFV